MESKFVKADTNLPLYIYENLSPVLECAQITSPRLNYLKESKQLNEFCYNFSKNMGAPFPDSIPPNLKIYTACGGSQLLIGAFFYSIQKILDRKVRVAVSTPPPNYYVYKNLSLIFNNIEFVDWEVNFPENIDLVIINSPSNPLGIVENPYKSLPYIPQYILVDVIYD